MFYEVSHFNFGEEWSDHNFAKYLDTVLDCLDRVFIYYSSKVLLRDYDGSFTHYETIYEIPKEKFHNCIICDENHTFYYRIRKYYFNDKD